MACFSDTGQLLDYPMKEAILKDAGRKFICALDITSALMANLVNYNVLTNMDALDILALPKPSQQRYELLQHLYTCGLQQFINFCVVLCDLGRKDVVRDVFKLNIDQLKVQREPMMPGAHATFSSLKICKHKQHFYINPETKRKEEIDQDLIPGIIDHCRTAERYLMKGLACGIDDEDPLDLTELYIETDPDCEVSKRDRKKIKISQMFLKLFQARAPNSVKLEGDAGTGKSSLLEYIAYQCCREMLKCEKKGHSVPCEGHLWKFIVYMNMASISNTENMEQSIMENIHCDVQDRVKLFQLIGARGKEGNGVGLFLDSADEIMAKKEVEQVKRFADEHQKHHQSKLLVASRKGLCCVPGKAFNRFLTLDGFTQNQGIQYMENYYMRRFFLSNHEVLSYTQKHRKKLQWVLCNPLRCSIFSELTASGSMTLEDVKTLTMANLLKCLEAYVLRYDEKKFGEEDHSSVEFYELCLRCLLRSDLEKTIPEGKFPTKSPRMVFLSKRRVLDRFAKENTYFVFTHQVLFEHFCSQGIIYHLKTIPADSMKHAFLNLFCSDIHMRDVLLLTCEHIAVGEPDLLSCITYIVQACLILQTPSVKCSMNSISFRMQQLRNNLQPYLSKIPGDAILDNDLSMEQKDVLGKSVGFVQEAFTDYDSRRLREAGWLFNYEVYPLYNRYGPDLEFIVGCMRACSIHQQGQICKQSTHRLLPSLCCNLVNHNTSFRDQYLVPVTETRWAIIREDMHGLEMRAWIPCDVVSALHQVSNFDHINHAIDLGMDHVKLAHLSFESCIPLWGEQPHQELTEEKWLPALKLLLSSNMTQYELCMDELTPIGGLLTALPKAISEAWTGWEVIVTRGQVDEAALNCLMSKSARVNLREVTVCVASDEDDETYVALLQRNFKHLLSNPNYMSCDGKLIIPCQKVAQALEDAILNPKVFQDILKTTYITQNITPEVWTWVKDNADIAAENITLAMQLASSGVSLTHNQFREMQGILDMTWILNKADIEHERFTRETPKITNAQLDSFIEEVNDLIGLLNASSNTSSSTNTREQKADDNSRFPRGLIF